MTRTARTGSAVSSMVAGAQIERWAPAPTGQQRTGGSGAGAAGGKPVCAFAAVRGAPSAQGQRGQPRKSPPQTPQSAMQEPPSGTVAAPPAQQCFRRGLCGRNHTRIGQNSYVSIYTDFEMFKLPQHTTERRWRTKWRSRAGNHDIARIALSVKVGGVVRWGIQTRSGVVDGLHKQLGSKT